MPIPAAGGGGFQPSPSLPLPPLPAPPVPAPAPSLIPPGSEMSALEQLAREVDLQQKQQEQLASFSSASPAACAAAASSSADVAVAAVPPAAVRAPSVTKPSSGYERTNFCLCFSVFVRVLFFPPLLSSLLLLLLSLYCDDANNGCIGLDWIGFGVKQGAGASA